MKNIHNNIEISPKVKESLEKLANASKQFAITTQPIVASLEALQKAMQPIVERQNQLLEGVRKSIEQLQVSLPKIEIPEGFIKALNNIRYLSFLQKIQWPLFLENNDSLQEKLLPYSEIEDPSLNEISELICSYYDKEEINNILSSWINEAKIESERLCILAEAIKMHNQEQYYSSTALLMTQVNGIITKMDKYITDNNFEINEEEIKFICEYYKVSYENHKKYVGRSERSQMLRFMAVSENGSFYWEAVVKYIRNVILESKDNEELMLHNPLRNKIFHGIQLNYGTKEHSLKAILTIDLLIQYFREIKMIIDNSKQFNRY